MKTQDVVRLEQTLKATEANALRSLARRDGLEVQPSPDPSDEAQFSLDRELTARSLNHESHLLVAVRSALQRIADDAYGACQRCEEQIGIKRLSALPWANYCVRCQEYVDREHRWNSRINSLQRPAA